MKRKSNELEYEQFGKALDDKSSVSSYPRFAKPSDFVPSSVIPRSIAGPHARPPLENPEPVVKKQVGQSAALAAPNMSRPAATDIDYENNMSTLITNIHKADGEWSRKRRDLNMAIARCTMNSATANTPAQFQLQNNVDQADGIATELSELERRHVTGHLISHTEQNEAKKKMTDLLQITKDSNKIKSFLRGVLHSV